MDKKRKTSPAFISSSGSRHSSPAISRPTAVSPPDNMDKEVPNTNGVVIWPEKILNEIKMLEQYDKAQRRKESDNTFSTDEEDFLVERLGLSESFEFFVMLVIVALIWWAGAYYVLKQHKFPFQRHYFEAAAIFVCPVLFIVALFSIVDRVYNYYYANKKNHGKNKKDV